MDDFSDRTPKCRNKVSALIQRELSHGSRIISAASYHHAQVPKLDQSKSIHTFLNRLCYRFRTFYAREL